jgi:hypothetical protein
VSVKDVAGAYAALAMLHAELGDYRAEARLLAEQGGQTRLPARIRAAAARKAQELRKHREGLNDATYPRADRARVE